MPDFMPGSDAQALAWMQAFAGLISADSARYGLLASDATSIQTAVDAFATAFATATTGSTRTSGSIATKDEKRFEAEQVCRFWAKSIKLNAGVTNEDKINLGLHINDTSPTPIDAPNTSPSLAIVAATPGAQTVTFRDSMSGEDSRKKPFGAESLYLYVTIAETAVTDRSEARFIGRFKKNPIGVPFEQADDGKVATYFARWSGPRGDVGPWSLPASMRIAA